MVILMQYHDHYSRLCPFHKSLRGCINPVMSCHYINTICKTAHITTTTLQLRACSRFSSVQLYPYVLFALYTPLVFYTTSSIMAQPSSLSSKYRMNSGYEIPAVGYGVSLDVYTGDGIIANFFDRVLSCMS